jgi:hypothetical protein
LLLVSCASTTQDSTGPLRTTTAPQVAEPSAQVLSALSDGVVSAGELEAAYLNQVRCLEAGGAIGHYAFDLEIGPGMALDVGIVGEGREDRLTENLMFFCEQRHVGDLAGIYGGANPVTEEQRLLGAASIRRCLAEAGVEADGSVADLRSQIEQLVRSSDLNVDSRGAVADCYTAGDTGPWLELGT